MSVQSERPQRLVRNPTAPQARVQQAPLAPARLERQRQPEPEVREVEADHDVQGDVAAAPLHSLVPDLQGAARWVLPAITAGVVLVGAVLVIALK